MTFKSHSRSPPPRSRSRSPSRSQKKGARSVCRFHHDRPGSCRYGNRCRNEHLESRVGVLPDELVPEKSTNLRTCHAFSQSGFCSRGANCRYTHAAGLTKGSSGPNMGPPGGTRSKLGAPRSSGPSRVSSGGTRSKPAPLKSDGPYKSGAGSMKPFFRPLDKCPTDRGPAPMSSGGSGAKLPAHLKPCFDFFNKGKCERGEVCPYTHCEENAFCQSYLSKGHCRYGAECRFSHNQLRSNGPRPVASIRTVYPVAQRPGAPRRPSSDRPPTRARPILPAVQLCDHFSRTGSCKFEDRCRFAHAKRRHRSPSSDRRHRSPSSDRRYRREQSPDRRYRSPPSRRHGSPPGKRQRRESPNRRMIESPSRRPIESPSRRQVASPSRRHRESPNRRLLELPRVRRVGGPVLARREPNSAPIVQAVREYRYGRTTDGRNIVVHSELPPSRMLPPTARRLDPAIFEQSVANKQPVAYKRPVAYQQPVAQRQQQAAYEPKVAYPQVAPRGAAPTQQTTASTDSLAQQLLQQQKSQFEMQQKMMEQQLRQQQKQLEQQSQLLTVLSAKLLDAPVPEKQSVTVPTEIPTAVRGSAAGHQNLGMVATHHDHDHTSVSVAGVSGDVPQQNLYSSYATKSAVSRGEFNSSGTVGMGDYYRKRSENYEK
eukprot:82311_1